MMISHYEYLDLLIAHFPQVYVGRGHKTSKKKCLDGKKQTSAE